MNIVQINSVYNTGSTGRIVEGIADAARKRGHSSWAVYGRNAQPGPTDTYRIAGRSDHVLHGFQSLLLDSHGRGSKSATIRMLRWLDNIEPDVIGLHNAHGYYLNVSELFSYIKSNNIPLVWTLHDCWPFTGHCTYFDRFSCQRWKTGCYSCPMTSYYPRSFIDKSERNWAWKRSLFQGIKNLTFITPSYWLKDLVKQSFLNNYPVEVIHNGIDVDVFKPGRVNKNKVVLGVANVWDNRKGLSDFYLLREKLSSDWKILLVGLSQRQLSKLPPGIEGIKKTSSVAELAQYYSNATAFVNTTYSDNFPTTNIEALACGSPVITYNTGGSPEAVSSETGRVVSQGNIIDLVDALEEIALTPSDIWQSRCRKSAVSHFSACDKFKQHIEVMESAALGAF